MECELVGHGLGERDHRRPGVGAGVAGHQAYRLAGLVLGVIADRVHDVVRVDLEVGQVLAGGVQAPGSEDALVGAVHDHVVHSGHCQP
ncbi:hypothetical protein [Streptomyces sp. NPDC048361]|uniref:hypothetical protein n=1 Tax=Streptomyces sp. NPDC048361 TaxID=3154720 RepID=UPI00341406C7